MSKRGGFQFLWKMVLQGATFNAVVVVVVVSLLLLRLPMAILCEVSKINTLEFKLEKIIGIQKNVGKVRKNTFIRSCGDILYNLRSLVSRSMQQRNSILASVLSEYLLLLTRYFAHLSMASNLKICRKNILKMQDYGLTS